MPAVQRTVTQATGTVSKLIVAFEPTEDLRAHDFRAIAALDEARDRLDREFISTSISTESISTETTAGKPCRGRERRPVLALENHLPHSFPTGSFGGEELRIEVRSAERLLAERTLLPRPASALASGGVMRLELPVDAQGDVLVTIHRRHADGREERIFTETLQVPPPDRTLSYSDANSGR